MERQKLTLSAEAYPLEIRILIHCARRNLEQLNRDSLEQLIRGPVDWELLFRLADEHGLAALLQEHLSEIGEGIAPGDFVLRLREICRKCALRELLLCAEWVRIAGEFQQAGIPAVVHKGPMLAARAYGNVTLRQYNDLDIVISQRYVAEVLEQMPRLGYEAKFAGTRDGAGESQRIPGEYVFLNTANRALVEFHTERTLRYFPIVLDLEGMLRRATTVPLSDKEIRVFSREDEILMLAVHGAKDFWARLIWIADIAELVKQPPQLAWAELLERANAMRIRRMVRLAILLANEILGLELPPEIRSIVGADHAAEKLANELAESLRKDASRFDGILRRSLYRMGTVEGMWAGMRYWMRLSTAPTEEDWALMDAPQPLARSYAALRPLRLWRKYRRTSSLSS